MSIFIKKDIQKDDNFLDFEYMYKTYKNKIWLIICKHLADKQSCEEVLQDIFRIFDDNIEIFDNEEGAVKWLKTVTYNKIKDYNRKTQTYNYMFNPKKANNKTMVLLALGGLVVAAWWIFKGDSIDFYGQLSERLSAYFSGVNIVSGAFNMPRSLDYRIRYFLYDFASTFPYGNTIFGLSGDTIQPFFNEYNNSMGQIPTTIGMGYYYFGPILAPLYSIIFANVSFDAGISLNKNLHQNPMKCIRYLITAFYFSMGIVMYNIEITMTYFFCLILPMYLLEKIAYTKEY